MTAVIHQFSNYYPLRTTMKKTIINVFSTLAAVALSSVSVYAAGTDTWVGNTDANWSTAANWTTSGGSTPPANGDSLVFGAAGSAGASLNNDISGLTVNNINLNGPGSFTFGVNGLALNGTLTAAATVNETFSGGITIGSDVATAIKNTGSGTLALGALSENSGGTVDFLINGPITTTTANVNGILGGWATTNNSVSSATVGGWAANDGSGNIISYAGYTAGVPSGVNNTGNYRGGKMAEGWQFNQHHKIRIGDGGNIFTLQQWNFYGFPNPACHCRRVGCHEINQGWAGGSQICKQC